MIFSHEREIKCPENLGDHGIFSIRSIVSIANFDFCESDFFQLKQLDRYSNPKEILHYQNVKRRV